ncbi:MAG TPA: DUF3108 domain-containing protein [Luteibaculaceae bacterium]|nr:DUF3108 domain-containing protein [Luteibaculaceae bacterium]
MRTIVLTTAAIIALLPTSWAQGDSPSQLRRIKYDAFKPGEEVAYVLHYGPINAGTAILKVESTEKQAFGQSLLRIIGTGQTNGAFNWFFKVRDRYESYIDAHGVYPWMFYRRVDEGGYKIAQDYVFYQHRNYVNNGAGKKFETPDYAQDMLSAFYYARTFDMRNAKPGDILSVTTFIDDEVWTQKIKYVGRENVSIRTGTYRCLKFVPVVQRGRIFKDEGDLVVYISDDDNKILVLAKAEVLVGSIKMELTSAKGLAHPVAKIK